MRLGRCKNPLMLINRSLGQCFSSAAANEVKVDKHLLSKLRKNTGYPFSKCHNALRATNNELEEAVRWLEEQSEKEGWKKAEKVKGRATSQGLIGAIVQNNIAAMVEVNCETDFVSRNDIFRSLVSEIAHGALQFKKRIIQQNKMVNSLSGGHIAHLREIIPPHDLEETKITDQCIKDSIVSVINQLGENVVLKRAVTIATSESNAIGVYAHGNGFQDGCHYGKYSALVVVENSDKETKNLADLAAGLAQHVVGMQPLCIDKHPDHEEAETALLNQEYLLDGSATVRKILENNNAAVVDFVRYQCGE